MRQLSNGYPNHFTAFTFVSVSVHHRHRLMAPLYNISPLSHTTLRVPLSELQLAPSAFASVPSPTGDESDTIVATSTIPPSFNPRDAVEVWLDDASTTGTHTQSSDNDQLVTKNGSGSKDSAQAPQGAWWPGRVITMQGGFAHVEVFAPQPPDVNGEDCSKAPPHHLLRVGSSMVSCRTTLVKVSELRTPWYGYQATAGSSGKDSPRNNNPSVLTNPGVLHRHTVCIPAYLSHM